MTKAESLLDKTLVPSDETHPNLWLAGYMLGSVPGLMIGVTTAAILAFSKQIKSVNLGRVVHR